MKSRLNDTARLLAIAILCVGALLVWVLLELWDRVRRQIAGLWAAEAVRGSGEA